MSKWGDSKFGAFWIDDDTMKEIMQTFQNSGIFSPNYKDYMIRESLAVIRKWSELSIRVKIVLLKDVVCYVGDIETQRDYIEYKNERELIGGDKFKNSWKRESEHSSNM